MTTVIVVALALVVVAIAIRALWKAERAEQIRRMKIDLRIRELAAKRLVDLCIFTDAPQFTYTPRILTLAEYRRYLERKLIAGIGWNGPPAEEIIGATCFHFDPFSFSVATRREPSTWRVYVRSVAKGAAGVAEAKEGA